MYYGGTITVAGRNIITNLIAGKTIELTRVVVGKGKMPEGVEPIDMTDLVEPFAEGSTTRPVVENNVLNMTIEYRNDMNGGLQESFWLNEFGLYAKTEDTDEVLFYYATLGDSPQPVNAYKDNRVDIRRFPISIAIASDAAVEIAYRPSTFVTESDAERIISVKLGLALSNTSSTIVEKLNIARSNWEELSDEEKEITGYKYKNDIYIEKVTADHFPNIAIASTDAQIAYNAVICPTAETGEGYVRLWSSLIPEEDIEADAIFIAMLTIKDIGYLDDLPIASENILGCVKIGKGLKVTDEGVVSTTANEDNIPTDEEVEQMISEIFG